jgi:two-component system, OmpR family, sensor kinase
MTRHLSALLRRLWRAQLRLKVMAGVVVVTLVALVAFDVAAVAVMRANLIDQTDSNLEGALALTVPRLAKMLAMPPPGPFTSQGRVVSGPRAQGSPPGKPGQIEAVAGAYDMYFVPSRGAQVTLQVGAGGGAGISWKLPSGNPQVALKPGPQTLVAKQGNAQIRADSIHVKGGVLVAGISLGQVDSTMDQVELIVTFGSIAIAALIGIGVFFVLRRGLRPIEAMAAQADKITAGDLTARVIARTPRSEVGRLGTALNGMLARIEAGVHEREASQEQMRRFFADASHELRTPLASLRANAELYRQGALSSPDQVDEVMRRITLETRRMGRLVDDMLRLARLGLSPGQYREPVDLTALISDAAERVRIAEPARIWRVHVTDGLATVGDEELLRRAVDNLLTNVLVHTPSDATGTITASAAAGTITLEVSDDGPGVPPDRLPHIFERFYRAGARSSRPGSGLGLAITAEIAAAHGGSAQAALATPHGLVITLTVPQEVAPQVGPGDWSSGRGSGGRPPRGVRGTGPPGGGPGVVPRVTEPPSPPRRRVGHRDLSI